MKITELATNKYFDVCKNAGCVRLDVTKKRPQEKTKNKMDEKEI